MTSAPPCRADGPVAQPPAGGDVASEDERLVALAAHGLGDADGSSVSEGVGALATDPEVAAALRLVLAVTGAHQASLNVLSAREQHSLVLPRGVGGVPEAADLVTMVVPREQSMCSWGRSLEGLGATTVSSDEVSAEVVHTEDARADPRWSCLPHVDGSRGSVRGFASAPLSDREGRLLGSLCVFDSDSLELSAAQLTGLGDLAQLASALLGRRREVLAAERSASLAEQRRALLDLLYAESASRSEMMDAVLDTIDVAVVACDASGHITLFNRAAREWHGGYPDPDVSAAAHSERYGLYEMDGVTLLPFEKVPMLRALLGEVVTNAEMILAPAGLPRRVTLCSARALTAVDGTVLGAVVAMADVTADRQRRSELQRSNTDLEHFAASASHDLAAPLAVIGGYLELVADEYGPALGEQGLAWVETSTSGVRRMQALISALLAYARAGGAELRTEPTSVAAVTAAALADLDAALRVAGASVVLDDLPQVDADPVLVRQLVQNLVSNAVNHRREHGACRVRISAERAGSWWIVSVADNGPGIPPSVRESVFDVFSTGSTGRRRGGHGIGLATCRRTVERHGGRIWVEATPGGGATVRFMLPAA